MYDTYNSTVDLQFNRKHKKRHMRKYKETLQTKAEEKVAAEDCYYILECYYRNRLVLSMKEIVIFRHYTTRGY